MPVARWRCGRGAREDGGGAWVAAGQEVVWHLSALARAVLAARADKHVEEIEQRAEAAQRAAEEARAAAAALAATAAAAAADRSLTWTKQRRGAGADWLARRAARALACEVGPGPRPERVRMA
eukprot:4208288-Alexandrium_andersonii.AAC.1